MTTNESHVVASRIIIVQQIFNDNIWVKINYCHMFFLCRAFSTYFIIILLLYTFIALVHFIQHQMQNTVILVFSNREGVGVGGGCLFMYFAFLTKISCVNFGRPTCKFLLNYDALFGILIFFCIFWRIWVILIDLTLGGHNVLVSHDSSSGTPYSGPPPSLLAWQNGIKWIIQKIFTKKIFF